MERNSNEKISTLKLASDLTSIPKLLEWFDQFLDAPLTQSLWIQAQTALVEGFTNAVRHAHAHLDPAPEVETILMVSGQRVCIEIKDQGPGFDLEAAWLELSQQLQREDFDPLDREEHWGNLLLLKLRNDHGWDISYLRQSDDQNCFLISHSLNDVTSVHS